MNTVVYLQAADLARLSASSEPLVGWSYEWEGEGVVHLALDPLPHAFGMAGKCLFVAPGSPEVCESQSDGIRWVLRLPDGVPEAICMADGAICPVLLIPDRSDLYSRSKGLLEVDVLREKTVMIVGLGSFGSQIAVELARAGVGRFLIWDFDRLEPHNLARHTGGINDLGRLKTDIIAEQILQKNPYAEVHKYNADICDLPEEAADAVAASDLVICATDNNPSRFYLSELLVEHATVGIFGRAITRAEGGDVFRYRPGGPCYGCLLGQNAFKVEEEITDVASARRSGAIAAYVSPEDADAMVQVGLSADIAPITNMMVKLSLVELSRGASSGIECLEEELPFDYYMWANRRERRHGTWAPFPTAGAQPSILRWYGCLIEAKSDCPVCGNEIPELEI